MVKNLNSSLANDIRREIVGLDKQLKELSDKLSDEIIQLNVTVNCRRVFPTATVYKTRPKHHYAVIQGYELEYAELLRKIDALKSLLDSFGPDNVLNQLNTDSLTRNFVSRDELNYTRGITPV